MAITSLQLNMAAEKAIEAAVFGTTPLRFFATSFNKAESTKGATIRVPIFNVGESALFDAESNNYASGDAGVSGVDINLNQHLVKSVSYTDRDFVECDVDFWTKAGAAIGRSLSRQAVKSIIGQLNETNVTATHSFDTAAAKDKDATAALYSVAAEADIYPAQAVLVVKPSIYASILAQLDTNVYGGEEAIRTGIVENLYGFKAVFASTELAEGVNGAIVHEEAIGIAGRPLTPAVEGAYPEFGTVTDEKTGFTIGFRKFTDLVSGKNYLAGEMLYGSNLLQPKAAVLLVD
jgi:hypothetical protein